MLQAVEWSREVKCSGEHFILTSIAFGDVVVFMKTAVTRWCWRKDLCEFRGLTDTERSGVLLVLEWFEN